MSYEGKEYRLFTYEVLSQIKPSLKRWTPEDYVCVSQNGKISFDYEFISWISSVLFPYKSFVDHTSSISIDSLKNSTTTIKIRPDFLLFKKATI